MDTDTLIKSVGSFMDSLESITNWLIIIMLLKLWDTFTGQDEFKVLGARIPKHLTTTALLGVYCFAFAALSLQLGRLHEILRYIPDSQFGVAATTVVTHTWLLNPFSYFGNDPAEILFGAICFGLWPIIWWVGIISITSAKPGMKNWLNNVLLGFYIISSGWILLLIFFIHTSLPRHDFGVSYWMSALLKLLSVAAGGLAGYQFKMKLVAALPKEESNIEKEMD